MLFADLGVRRINDTGGYENLSDGFIGDFPSPFERPVSSERGIVNGSAWEEVRDQVHIGRVRAIAIPGGGSLE